jgi:chromosome segregation ATPase
MGAIEGKFKGELEKRISTVIKKAEDEKAKYDKATNNVSELSDHIKNYMEKFETLKEDMAESQSSFNDFKMETDTNKAEIMTLETTMASMQ